jgi:MoxR-like ATPase
VVATQNPIDQEGTYPLAESQKDRFLMRLTVGYPEPGTEPSILGSFEEPLKIPISPVGLDAEQILALRDQIRTIHCAPVLVEWAAKVIQATRQPAQVGLKDQVLWGVSPRGGRMWLKAARARAWWMGRDFVVPEDLKALAESALGHRIVSHWTSSQVDLESPLTERIMDRLGPP